MKKIINSITLLALLNFASCSTDKVQEESNAWTKSEKCYYVYGYSEISGKKYLLVTLEPRKELYYQTKYKIDITNFNPTPSKYSPTICGNDLILLPE